MGRPTLPTSGKAHVLRSTQRGSFAYVAAVLVEPEERVFDKGDVPDRVNAGFGWARRSASGRSSGTLDTFPSGRLDLAER